MARSPIDRAVRAARRRLFLQALLHRLCAGWAVALAVGLAWVLVEPLLIDPAPDALRWGVIGGLAGLAAVWALVQTIRTRPSRVAAALEVDSRFELRERLTSAVGLPDSARDTEAGKALVADAEAHAGELKVRAKFPVRPAWSAAWVLGLAAAVAVVAFVYHPIKDSPQWAEAKQKTNDKDGPKATDGPGPRPANPPVRPRPDRLDRPNKSDKLKELEAELDRLERAAKDPIDKPAEAREKVSEITNAEERAKRYEQEQHDKLARMEHQLRQLEKLNNTEDFKDGSPAKALNDALAKGDIAKAKEQVDELRKKAKKQELTPDERKQLEQQLDKMQDELQRLARNQEQQDKLKELIDKAKKEGRDAESLERELEKLKADAKQNPGMQDLAEKLQKAQQQMKAGNMEEAAKQLEQVADQLRQLQGDIQDLEDVQDHLQRLKEMKAAACKQCEGDGEGQGQGKDGNGKANGKRPGGGRAEGASGERPENPDAKTDRGADERQRTPFDPRGRKTYGGTTSGPSFTKRSPTELTPAIEQAVQEAPEALDTQKLPRDDKDAVKEFYQRLGNQKR